MRSAATADTYAERLEHALPALRERVQLAAAASGRQPAAVRIVAVSKAHPLEAVEAAVAMGLGDLGENRVEELEEKVRARGSEGIRWHMIGHVQSRKAKRAADLSHLIHSLDSESLSQRLSRIGMDEAREIGVLVQVNTSGEASKSGLEDRDAVASIHRIAELPGLRVEGLMTMAPWGAEDAVLHTAFGRLREIREALRRVTSRVGPELSMGMTNDLEIAIREGSTMIRIGTALFGERSR